MQKHLTNPFHLGFGEYTFLTFVLAAGMNILRLINDSKCLGWRFKAHGKINATNEGAKCLKSPNVSAQWDPG